MQKIIIVGNLGGDPEVKEWDDGSKTTTFSVATSEKYKDRSGELQEITEWFRVKVGGVQAGPCGQYLAKGRKVAVEGKQRTRKYTDKDGNERSIVELRADRVEFLSSKGEASGGGEEASSDATPF